jgi:hypothetical protein
MRLLAHKTTGYAQPKCLCCGRFQPALSFAWHMFQAVLPHRMAVLVFFRNILFTFGGKFQRCSSKATAPKLPWEHAKNINSLS